MTQTLPSEAEQTIVIVEDESVIRTLATWELEDCGFHVVEFETADDALPYLRQHGCEACVIVTDVQMPGSVDGLQLTDIISRLWPEARVLVTSGGSLVDPSRLPECAAFMAKPWQPADMVERVRSLAARPRAHAESAA